MREFIDKQHNFFQSGKTLDYSFRLKQLQTLKKMIQTYERNIYTALKTDLNKSKHEAYTTEIGFLYIEIEFAIKNLKTWMKNEKVDAPLTHKGTQSYIIKEPYGVALIISPWNYPLQLTFGPMIGAIAAGNTVIVKPSEFSKATSSLINHMIKETFNPSFITVIEGDKETNQQLLKEKFDYIFFTGSTAVGKVIMRAASEHLTPVTLELGGKSPAIINSDAHINLAAKRIVWGKFTNAGQTCVAPDFLYVHEKVKNKLIKAIKKHIQSFYGKKPLQNTDYVQIINEDHFLRLTKLLSNGEIIYGGNVDTEKLSIEPTLLDHITWDDPIMEDEIFGPILPILTFSKLEAAISELKTMDKPLALYYFGEGAKPQNKVLEQISFGGGCINDTLYHLANPNLPFGGVGKSGIGAYHGKYSFDAFSHSKSIMKQTTKLDIPLRYPGGRLKHMFVKRVMKG